MDRLRIAVIDTGVDPSHAALAPVRGGAGLSLGTDGAVHVADDWRDATGHGTACAGLCSRDLHARLELLALRVVDDRGTSTVRLLEAAIPWAVERGARVINVSLGAPVWQEEARDRLRDVCAEAARRGALIIAAAGPDGTSALPAALEEVVSVGSAVCPLDTLYAADDANLDFLAKGDLQRVPWLAAQSVLAQGTSLAAAHVTNAACKILLQKPGLDPQGLRAALSALAIQGDSASRSARRQLVDAFYRDRTPRRAEGLGRVALYPFNKEAHALVRYRALAPFTLSAVADPPGKRLTGRDAGEVLGEPPAGLPILASLDHALEGVDSVILGHLEALQGEGARALLPALARRAITQGKGLYSFSRLAGPELAELRVEAERRGLPFVDPTVSRAEVAPLLEGRRRAGEPLVHDCPVLGVFGTSRSQGKFSLQLALRAALAQMGYRVAHFATEPTGMLLGASVTLPTGHERGNDLSIEETASLAHLLVTELKNRERPDLLLVGGQSGAVPPSPDFQRYGLGSLSMLAFAAATQPDASVLVCNPEDPPEHVDRCRGALESVLHAPVIVAAFGDQIREERVWKGVPRHRTVRLGEAALAERLAGWEARLRIPCCGVLSAGGPARLAALVVEHFASAAPPDEKAL